LDKDRAESLERDNAEIQAQLAKYPKGMASLTSEGGISSYGITDDDSPRPGGGAPGEGHDIQMRLWRRVSEIGEEATKDPAQSLSDALALPLEAPGSSPRVAALEAVARAAAKKKSSVAKSALDEILKIEDQLTPKQMQSLSNLGKVFLELGDEDGAKKTLKVMLKAAEKLYADDTNADDPNKSFKGIWPSADLWRQCVQTASKISPSLAEEVVGEIADQEIAALQKVVFASSLMSAHGMPVLVANCRRNGSSYQFSD